jgi:3-oxoacyl-[acyl-carrier-protein] synthase-3
MESRKFSILGAGVYSPRNVVSSEAIDRRLGLREGTVSAKSGVKTRRFVSSDETTVSMAAAAARDALKSSGLAWSDIDCIVSASGTVEQAIPCTAVLVKRALGLSEIQTPCFDINSTCLSFVSALDTVTALMQVGRYRNVLIVSSDIPSHGLDWTHLESCTIFGDGAAAFVVGVGAAGIGMRVLSSHMETYSDAADVCRVRSGGTRLHPMKSDVLATAVLEGSIFEMDGKAAYKVSATHVGGFVERLFGDAGVAMGDIDLVVPHQASLLGMHHLRKKLGIPTDKLVDIFSDHGNQVAASMPTALHHAWSKGMLMPGSKVLLIGTGAGISIAGMVLEVA